jgi:hypothetical protein
MGGHPMTSFLTHRRETVQVIETARSIGFGILLRHWHPRANPLSIECTRYGQPYIAVQPGPTEGAPGTVVVGWQHAEHVPRDATTHIDAIVRAAERQGWMVQSGTGWRQLDRVPADRLGSIAWRLAEVFEIRWGNDVECE